MIRPARTGGRGRRRAAGVACGVVLLAAGCGGDDPEQLQPAEAAAVAVQPSAIFALSQRPRRPLDAEAARATAHSPEARPEGFSVTIVATFPTPAEARSARRELARVFADTAAWLADGATAAQRSAHAPQDVLPPLAPPEAAWLRAHGVPRPAGGIGWAGLRPDAEPLRVLGSTLFVGDLKYVAAYDEGEEYTNPLVAALAAMGAEVLVEGDRGGEGAIVVDLTCTADPDVAQSLGADIADHVFLPRGFLARPPWSTPGLTPRQRSARHTYRLVGEEQAARFEELLSADPELDELALEIASSPAAEGRERLARLQRRVLDHLLAAAPDLEDASLDPVVVSWYAADRAEREHAAAAGAGMPVGPPADEAGARAEQELERGAYVGQLRHARAPDGRPIAAPGEADESASYALVGVSGRRLDVGWVAGGRIAVLLPSLVRWLDRGGCDGFAYALVDFDDVRGD